MNETEIVNGYRAGAGWEPSFWERGSVRYAALSYSLWARLIWKTHRAYRRKLKMERG